MKDYVRENHDNKPSIITNPYNVAFQAISKLRRSIDETLPEIFCMHYNTALRFHLTVRNASRRAG